MTRGRAALVALIALMAASLLAVAGAAGWIFYTPSGFAWLTARLAGFAGEGLTLDGASGTLARGARVAAIRFVGEDIEVDVRDAAFALSPGSLLTLEPRIEFLRAARVSVTTKPGEPRGWPPDTLELPLDVELVESHVGRLVLDLGQGPMDLADVQVAYAGGKTRHTVRDLTLTGFGYALAMRGRIDAQAPFGIDAAVTAVKREGPGGSAYAHIEGTLTELAVNGGARLGEARVRASASVRPYDDLPIVSVAADASGVDLETLAENLPRTALSGRLELTRADGVLTGPVRITNALPGPYDTDRLPVEHLRARLSTNLKVAGFTSLAADLGSAGSISGSGDVEGASAVLSLKTPRLDLSGLHTRLRETHLAGAADIRIDEARQSVRADLSQDDIELSVTAERAGDVVEIPRFRAAARGGVATGEARVNLSGAQPYSIEASFREFDPAAWGDFPAGSINGSAQASGAITEKTVEAQFAIRDSSWLDAPLSASGEVSLTADALRHMNVDATLGGNRLSAEGALGGSNDVLAVQIDAPRPGLLDAQLSGRLRGTARLTGEWRAPRITFDVSGSRLAHAEYGSVNSLEAEGTVSLDARGAMNVEAALRGISTPQLTLKSVRLDLDGTRAAHALSLNVTGDRIDAGLRAQGSWRPSGGWRGTIQELANRGEVPVRLTAPVSLELSPARVQLEPFTLEAVGGRLSVSRLRYEKGRFVTEGELEQLPVGRLLALAGDPAGVSGTLQLSGSWIVSNAPQWQGTVRVHRASGDLVIGVGVGQTAELGLENLTITADLSPREIAVKADIDAALASVDVRGRVMPAGPGANPGYGPTSPIDFTAEVDVARLAPLAEYIQTTMLIAGEAHARVQARGTLQDPDVTGTITGRDLALTLPAEGIAYTQGRLTATVTRETIRLESFSIQGGDGVLTARGTLARAGFDAASVDWRAERFTALARPDRRLVVSGQGNARLDAGKVSLTGKLSADDGRFEIGTTALPQLGDDVVIVGRSPESEKRPAKRFKAFALDMNVSLGERVHVLGSGLSVWLAGDVHVFTNEQGEIRAEGTVNARNGTFVAYGQRLEIDRGSIYFNGPITDPALDIVAVRRRLAVEPGVAITGTLRNPLVRVISDPPLPQGEALAWLLLGRAPDQAGTGELSALPLAQAAVLGKATGSIARRLNLDELGLRSGGADQFLTLGKRLTDRVYLTFEQGLGAAESLLRLELTLTERVVLRAQAGDTSLLGLFYRYRWD